MTTEIATLGGGCFWCLEAVFRDLKGVQSVVSGYSGGHVENPSYEQVSLGTTGHAEVVNIAFDPDVISYRDILTIFFTIHDPTTPNQQGNDIGPQYRSVVFYHTPEQKEVAGDVMAQMSSLWSSPLVTQLDAFTRFYEAEDYHQDYFRNNRDQGYCRLVIEPKVAAFRQFFSSFLNA